MVGHSLGGLDVRVFVHDYSSDVSGVVLIESMNPKQLPQAPVGVWPQSNLQSPLYSVLGVLARFGVARLLARPVTHMLSPQILPNENAYYARFVRPQSMQAVTNESKGLPASGVEAAAVKSFGDLPLIVLTGRLHTDPPNWPTWQTELLQLSSNSQQLFAENGNHVIQIEELDAAVAAISRWSSRSAGQGRSRRHVPLSPVSDLT